MGDGCDSGEGEQMEEEQVDLMHGENLAAAAHLTAGGKQQGQGEHLEELSSHLGDNQTLLQNFGDNNQTLLQNLGDNQQALLQNLGDNEALLQMEEELPQHPALLQCSSRKVTYCEKLRPALKWHF